MILVTCGTHEQGFDRLVKKVDELAGEGVISDVIIQTGYTEYEPQHCKWQKFFPYQEMQRLAKKADIIISHGGPSSFVMALQNGKVPIVVPRRPEFGEHVNDHQVIFCHAVQERNGNIIVVDNVDILKMILQRYDQIVSVMPVGIRSNNDKFCEDFEHLVEDVVEGKR